MTSARGQNVSVLQFLGPEPLEPPAGRAAQHNSFRISKNTSMNGKSSSQHSLASPVGGPGRNPIAEAYSSSGKSPSGLNSSNSVNRELSPVRWCDREVDGVYLGRAGWVQVQQRSLDDSKGTARTQSAASTLPRKYFSNSVTNSLDRREPNRPINLPLPSKRRPNAGNHLPSSFIQELESVPPPSVTPILSPPPAFRDEGMGADVSVHVLNQPSYLKDSSYLKSRFPADSADSLTSPAGVEGRSVASPGQRLHSHQFSQTKSLDENSLERRNRTDLALFAFHSFDNDFRKTLKDFRSPDNFEEYGEDNEENGFEQYVGQQTFCERLNGRDGAKSYRQRKYQLNGKRSNDSSCGYKARSSSSDSDSSSSEDSDRCRQRRFGGKQSQRMEALNGGGSKHFNVKRSRSLQLSEERPPRELMLMSHSSSGRSWDRVSPESPTFQANESSHLQSLRHLHQVMVTVNGHSIPVLSSDDRSLNLLNKITSSEEEQKKLIREAEKEARLISEFLNGTRSRAAARNLLIHRYFARPDPAAKRLPSKPPPWNPGTLPQETPTLPPRHDERPHPDPTYSKTLPRPYPTPTPLENPHPPKEFTHLPRQLTDPRSKRSHPPLQSNPSQRQRSKAGKSRVVERPHGGHFPGDTRSLGRPSRGGALQTSTSSSDDACEEDTKARNISSASELSLNCLCLDSFPADEDSKANHFHSRSASAPETDDCTSGPDQRSLSLPRSFLSDQYRLNYFGRRNSFPWRQERGSALSGPITLWVTEESPSRTAPTTPVRDSRDDRSSKPANRGKRNRVSRITLLNESSSLRPQWMEPKALENPSIYDRRTSKVPDCLSEIAPQNAQDFPFKVTRTRGSCHGSISRESENDSERILREVMLPLDGHMIYSIPTPKNDSKAPNQSLRQTAPLCAIKKERRLRNGAFYYDKYDSYDSGIQIGVRGNIDSSESQDTDLQEDADNLYLGSLHRGVKISGHISRKGVRRTKSDLGGLRLVNWDVKNHQKRLASKASSLRGSQTTDLWKPLSPEDSAIFERSLKPPLRRSLSLSELPPFEARKPSKPFTFSEDEKNLFGATSDDELLSDSESSVASLSDRKKPSHPQRKEEPVVFAEAVWDNVAIEPFELPFRAGDVIEVLDTKDRHWWWGVTEERCGYFPSAFVRLRVSQESSVEDCFVAATPAAFDTSSKSRRSKNSLLSTEQVRSSVVRELLNTEREFVKILRDVKEGYILECSRRPDMFTSAQISTIFSNLEDILVFQEQFLKDLERRIDQEFPHKSCVGDAFLNHSSGFRVYSEYCNSHPIAMATLQDLCQKNNYCKFFEMCRLKQNLTEIPLDGYLLTPVQRICKYPLQLAELLKYTKPDHPDFGKVEKALEAMRSVAVLINERKRKMESLEKLAAWQQRVEGWEGEDLIESSSQLILQGDVVRITSGMWTTNVTLFLFDHQIIYCKRDLLKRNHHIYKGRISLDESEVVDLPDGKNQQLGVTVKYGIKICSSLKDKWLVFCCRSSEEKLKWLDALAEERRLVVQDKEVGLDLPPTAKQLADMAARTKKIISSKARGKNKIGASYEEISQLRHSPLGAAKGKGGRRMGTWFTFAGVMKSPKANLRHRNSLQQVT